MTKELEDIRDNLIFKAFPDLKDDGLKSIFKRDAEIAKSFFDAAVKELEPLIKTLQIVNNCHLHECSFSLSSCGCKKNMDSDLKKLGVTDREGG